jgi:hypothetical protein
MKIIKADFMARPKEQLLVKLREQMELLHSSVTAFYSGHFAQALRIATSIRVLVHETGGSKPLLKLIRPDGLSLEIPGHTDDTRPGEDEIIRFAVGIRLGPGNSVAPAVDVHAASYSLTTIGAWWARTVFIFQSKLGIQVTYSRKQVVVLFAYSVGGAHVDPNEDRDYVRLRSDAPISFTSGGVRVDTPDLARYLVAQSGVELLECLKLNFFHDYELPPAWECGAAAHNSVYMDQISIKASRVTAAFPSARIRVTKRK